MNNTYQKQQNNTNKERPTYLDYNIFSGNIRLITDDGSVKIIDRDAAINIAKSKGMNLVQVSYSKKEHPHAICKIMDYGKFKFEQKKKEKEAARKARISNAEAKDIFFSIRIDENDINVKISHIREFLENKNKVRINIKLTKREMHLLGMAKDLMHKILSKLEDIAEFDGNPSFNSGILTCCIKYKK